MAEPVSDAFATPLPTAIRRWLAGRYDIGAVTEITLLRALTNSVHRLETSTSRYVLKRYRSGWRTRDEIAWEIALLDHLAASEVRVTPAIPARDGDPIQAWSPETGAPLLVLFAFVAGRKPEPPFPPALYRREGRAVAHLHAALDGFVPGPALTRPPLDLTTLLDEPLALVLPHLTDAATARSLRDTAATIHDRIVALDPGHLDWGPCHGDLTYDNLHLTDDCDFVWYDFDSGGAGWRAIDLQGWAAFDPATRALGDAFLTGYQEVRPLSDADIAAAPLLAVADAVRGMDIDLRFHTAGQDPRAVAAELDRRIARCAADLAAIP